jgi:hypothetical protein
MATYGTNGLRVGDRFMVNAQDGGSPPGLATFLGPRGGVLGKCRIAYGEEELASQWMYRTGCHCDICVGRQKAYEEKHAENVAAGPNYFCILEQLVADGSVE